MKWGENHSFVSDSLRTHGLSSPWNSPGQNTGVGSHSLLQGIFLTHRLKPDLPHCRRILSQLRHKRDWLFFLHINIVILLYANLHLRFSLKKVNILIISVQFSSVMSNSLWPHGLQHVRPPCPSLTSRAFSNSCPSSQWWHPAISISVVPFSSCFNLSQHGVFSKESGLHIRWPKDWSFNFNISPSNQFFGTQLSLVQLSHPYMTTGETTTLTRWTFVSN